MRATATHKLPFPPKKRERRISRTPNFSKNLAAQKFCPGLLANICQLKFIEILVEARRMRDNIDSRRCVSVRAD